MHQNASCFRLTNMEKIRPPQDLKRNILLGIAKEEFRRAKVYFTVAATVLPVSLVAMFLSGRYLLNSFYESGFYDYLSLLFSGDSIVLSYWEELMYSLVETMPIVGTIVFLIASSFFIWSGANTLTNLRRFALTAN
ncbi:MAG: hypothetical protein A3F51_01020 [Candidatus Taylorbacteria bacterium RIFCSPHIGHO2_12_FULL_45_16]|uniref:Uncharacterized protein n=1 Tax=Candidatus Taylorbacteria bacterium RIFCSPHIGHO2_12_FULL_45_16 TaxID=1802315 RepID=A0A1G2MZB7_9BACT|nr:MAG: hypothetical protein A3F51_01020 [Candidatus Taylorbacteria bacterium RIFCSPHIGHO2_12_FULL_45_16]OHA33400.1 MAG: hypothetical protein A3A23_01900 [Candidatus Taylorbacteria bacterium RIFCSPLOWO2_01_FULL_45_59]OHA39486.1 MAG: hypothetical protein A3I98_03870 [Candidatus Taylorbacteria bacterium RIFCSPLOWO2_02_FULL_45_10b]